MPDQPTERDLEFLQWQQELTQQERLTQARLAADVPTKAPGYHLVTINEELFEAIVEQYSSPELLIEAMKKVEKPAVCVPIYGYPLRTTKPLGDTNLRFLVCPDGRLIPLFSVDGDVRLSESPMFAIEGEVMPRDDKEKEAKAKARADRNRAAAADGLPDEEDSELDESEDVEEEHEEEEEEVEDEHPSLGDQS